MLLWYVPAYKSYYAIYYNGILWRIFKNRSSFDLDILLGHIAISIIFKLTVQPLGRLLLDHEF